LKDPKLREAIDYTINRQKVVDIAMLGHGVPCPNQVGCGGLVEWSLHPDYGPTPYDPEMAKQILDDAGYVDTDGDGIRETPEGEPLSFRLFWDTFLPPMEITADVVSEGLAEVGIETDIEAVEHATFWQVTITDHDFDMGIARQFMDLDPSLMETYYRCPPVGHQNMAGYCSTTFDTALDGVQSAPGADRMDYMYEMQETFAQDRPYLGIAAGNSISAYRNDTFDFPDDACPWLNFFGGYWALMNVEPVQ
jgi:peptide/nickel transport system substrate-binding protein